MKVAIIKYNSGNTCSVSFALERLGIVPIITNDPEEIIASDKVIFPGVGEAGSTMKYLKEHKLDKLIVSLKQPVLGICLGMQLLCNHSEEGDTVCLGIFGEKVKKFDALLKVPQIGWNTVCNLKSPLFKGLREGEYMYFVHGYYASGGDDTIGTTEYGVRYSSALQKDNFYGVQFHPEKSGLAGQQVIANFINL